MYKDLDPILHQQLRLGVISWLAEHEKSDFNELREVTGASSGNLSVQITKLQEAGYIEVIKGFRGKYQHTAVKIIPKGFRAFESYVEALKGYFPK